MQFIRATAEDVNTPNPCSLSLGQLAGSNGFRRFGGVAFWLASAVRLLTGARFSLLFSLICETTD